MKKMLLVCGYLALAVPMFYFFGQDIHIGGFGFMYRYLFALGIILMAFLAFLIRPNFKKGMLTMKYSAVLMAPYAWTLLYSMLLWALSLAAFRVITRGFFYIIYQFIAVLAAAAVIYLFGHRGLYLQLLALFIADGIYVVQSIVENGLDVFLTEYIDLVVSLTGKTGMVMKSFEVLGHSYALGLFLVFFIINFKENRKQLPWCIVAAALFMLGLKRSVLGAMAVAILFGWLLNWLKHPKRWVRNISICAILFGIAYVYAVDMGVFHWLESVGIDTNGREWLFDKFAPYYDMGAGFFGRGAGFVAGSIVHGDIDLTINANYAYGDIHNDFLRQYIELGFWGFIMWMFLFLGPRISYFFHKGKEIAQRRHGVIAAAVIMVTYVTFMTENSLYHFYNTLFLAAVIMAYRFDEFAEQMKLPGA